MTAADDDCSWPRELMTHRGLMTQVATWSCIHEKKEGTERCKRDRHTSCPMSEPGRGSGWGCEYMAPTVSALEADVAEDTLVQWTHGRSRSGRDNR